MEHLINRKSTSFSHPRKNTQVFFPVTALHFIFLTAESENMKICRKTAANI